VYCWGKGSHCGTLVEPTGDRYPGEGLEEMGCSFPARGEEFRERSMSSSLGDLAYRAMDRNGAKTLLSPYKEGAGAYEISGGVCSAESC
jgi:hypothetical protein